MTSDFGARSPRVVSPSVEEAEPGAACVACCRRWEFLCPQYSSSAVVLGRSAKCPKMPSLLYQLELWAAVPSPPHHAALVTALAVVQPDLGASWAPLATGPFQPLPLTLLDLKTQVPFPNKALHHHHCPAGSPWVHDRSWPRPCSSPGFCHEQVLGGSL